MRVIKLPSSEARLLRGLQEHWHDHEGWGPRRIEFMGETAADRDIVLCKCPIPPRIVATLSDESWCGDMDETIDRVVSSRTTDGGVSSVVILRRRSPCKTTKNLSYAEQENSGQNELDTEFCQGSAPEGADLP
jgi:hypothetical protein